MNKNRAKSTKTRKSNPVKRYKKFFTHPATYVGPALQATPLLLVKYLDVDIAKEGIPTKTAYLTSLLIGQCIFFYSVFKNLADPFTMLKFWRISNQYKRVEARGWRWFGDVLSYFKKAGLADLDYIIARGETVLREKRDFEKARSFAYEGFAIIKRKQTVEARTKMGNTLDLLAEQEVERPTLDEKYLLAPAKSYNRFSNNQRLRVQYFVDDVGGLALEQKMRLYRNVRDSKWYNSTLTDMQTYMLFDDITINVRRGEIPATHEIEAYLKNIVSG